MSAIAGEILADELAARQWAPSHMAALCGLPEQAITAIIAGGPITPSVAERIGRALGTSAQMWLALRLLSTSMAIPRIMTTPGTPGR